MKISIIIPVYNKEAYLQRLYKSIINQSYKNYEIIFIDDGSTDNSVNIIKKIEKKDITVKTFIQKNSGPGLARKVGYSKSTGDLLYFIDADDYLPNNEVFESIINIYNKYNPDILLFDREDVTDNGTTTIEFFDRAPSKVKTGMYDINNFPNVYIHGGLGCKIFKREILKENMFSNYRNFEDSYTSYLYLDKCNNYYYINECLYTIYEKKDNVSFTKTKEFHDAQNYIEKMDVLLQTYNLVENETIKKSIIELYPETIVSSFFYLIKNKVDKNEKNKINKQIKQLLDICKKNNIKHINKTRKYHKIKQFLYYLLQL